MKRGNMRIGLNLTLAFFLVGVCGTARAGDLMAGKERLAYIGTLDRKLLIFNEDKEEVVGEIPLNGIPRVAVLSPDQTKIYIVDTKMVIETVDLAQRKVVDTMDLTDERSKVRITAASRTWLNGAGLVNRSSNIAVDPTGRYLYTTLRRIRKDNNEYFLDAPKFVQIDLQAHSIIKSFDFPKGYDTGFGFMASFKVSPDGKFLYVFDEDIAVIDLNTFEIVKRIPLAKPEYPGASPYHLSATDDDPYDGPNTVSSVSVSVDPIVHKPTLGLAKLDLRTNKYDFTPIGVDLPMIGFMVSPDKKYGYSVAYSGAGPNRVTEWWKWDLQSHQVVMKVPFESRPTFSFGISSDGKKLYLYGAGSTLEVYDAETLKSDKMLFINKDLTTRMVTLAYN